jgi:hypothetical protein
MVFGESEMKNEELSYLLGVENEKDECDYLAYRKTLPPIGDGEEWDKRCYELRRVRKHLKTWVFQFVPLLRLCPVCHKRLRVYKGWWSPMHWVYMWCEYDGYEYAQGYREPGMGGTLGFE